MTRTVVFELPAKADLAEVKLWLKSKRSGLDVDFMICLEACVEHVRRNPEACAVVSGRLRRANLHRFPYAIFYRYDTPVIRVFGVLHTSRHPRTWLGRGH